MLFSSRFTYMPFSFRLPSLFFNGMLQAGKQGPSPHGGKSSSTSPWEWLQEVDLHALEGQLNASAVRAAGRVPRSRIHVWLIRLSTSVLLWTCLVQLMALAQLWQPHLLKAWPPCFDRRDFSSPSSSSLQTPAMAIDASPSSSSSSLSGSSFASSSSLVMPRDSAASILSADHRFVYSPRSFRNNGYLLVSCNGGLNQMRAAICDMVAIAQLLNLTLVVPELDKTSFWADPSDFGDIFDVDHFISSLRDELKIVRHVPSKYHEKVMNGEVMSMPPVSWSNESYYLNQILPLVKKHKIIRFSKTDTRLANSGLPIAMQKLRCHVNYRALRFTPVIEELGKKLVRFLKSKGPFLVLHLRYEMDMLAFSGCTHGCTDDEADELTKMRYAYPWWKEKVIDSEQKRLDGLCPLTPEETALFLQASGFDKDTQIYIAAGEIYGSERRMAPLYAAFPSVEKHIVSAVKSAIFEYEAASGWIKALKYFLHLVRKEMLLSPDELRPFQNHSSQMAALDYLVAIESDVFVPTYDGNMAKVVEGHRRFLGYRKTIALNRKKLVELFDQYHNNTLSWDEFSTAVRQVHDDHMGAPGRRKVIPDRPKEEDYFYANPEECLA